MKIDMVTKQMIINKYKVRYQKLRSKKKKSILLDKVCEFTSFNRKYCSTLLSGKVVTKTISRSKKLKRNRSKYYDNSVRKILVKFWKYICLYSSRYIL